MRSFRHRYCWLTYTCLTTPLLKVYNFFAASYVVYRGYMRVRYICGYFNAYISVQNGFYYYYKAAVPILIRNIALLLRIVKII